jgi:hypothetical protein
MKNNIDDTLEYYNKKAQEILDIVNSGNNLATDQIIQYGEDLAIIEYKITALEIAKSN